MHDSTLATRSTRFVAPQGILSGTFLMQDTLPAGTFNASHSPHPFPTCVPDAQRSRWVKKCAHRSSVSPLSDKKPDIVMDKGSGCVKSIVIIDTDGTLTAAGEPSGNSVGGFEIESA